MKVDLTDDADFAAAVQAGVKAAFLDPEFRRALVNDVVAGFVWLTRQQVGELLGGKTDKTVKRWAQKRAITVSTAMGETEPLYLLQSVQEAMLGRAIRAKRQPAAPKPAKQEKPLAGRGVEPLRTVGRLNS